MTAARHLPVLPSGPGPVGAGDGGHVRGRRERGEARARTINIMQLSKRALDHEGRLYPERPGVDYRRPRTWGECEAADLGSAELPCPFVSCRHHLYLDVDEGNGSIKINFPGREPHELPATCALRVAEEGGITLDGLGARVNLTKERVRQLEERIVARLRVETAARGLRDGAAPDGAPPERPEVRDDHNARAELDLAPARSVVEFDFAFAPKWSTPEEP